MTVSQFLFILLLLGITYGFKDKITKLINQTLLQNSDNFKIKSIYISYFISILLFLTLILGMLVGSSTKEKFGNVDEGVQKVKNKDRPNPLFDIDTYW